VIVAPAELIVFAGEETPPARYAVIRPGRVRQFKVLGVQTPAPGIRATAEPLADGGYRIRIEGLRADPVLDGSRIRIRTDLGQGSEFEIPVRVLPAREPSAKPRS
jgi:hypothetical protein